LTWVTPLKSSVAVPEIVGSVLMAERLAGRVGGGEPVGPPPTFQRFELGHHARREG